MALSAQSCGIACKSINFDSHILSAVLFQMSLYGIALRLLSKKVLFLAVRAIELHSPYIDPDNRGVRYGILMSKQNIL